MRFHLPCFAVVVAVSLVIPVAVHAEDAAVLVASAKAHLEKREYDKAIADCNKAIELDFNSTAAYVTRGRAWFDKDDCDKAIADYDEAVSINPTFAEAYSNRARAWIGKYKYDKALADSDKAIALGSTSEETYIYRASAWLEKGDYKKAIADCNQALAFNVKSSSAFYCRAQVYWRCGEYEKADSDFKQSLKISPDDWNALNNLGVLHWMLAQRQEAKAAAADAAGDLEMAKTCRQESAALKSDAKAQWIRGVTVKPTATDIHSNLGYAYSEAASQAAAPEEASHFLDLAEQHLRRAVDLNPTRPRPHNNLGRIYLRRSQQCELAANVAEAKGKTDSAEAAKAKQLKDEAKAKLNAAIEQFEKAVELEPSLLEARLNLGEVYSQLGELDKAEAHYQAIQKFEEASKNKAKDLDALAYFSQAHFGLARIAFARGKSDKGIAELKQAIAVNPNNMQAMDRLARELFLRSNYREGEQVIRKWLFKLPPPARRQLAEQFGKRFESDGKHTQAIRAWDVMAWIFATNSEPKLRDPQAARGIADGIVKLTKQEDPLALDTLAAALAANDKFPPAVKAAQQAIDLANRQGNKPLAGAIAKRLELYKEEKPYRSDGDDSGRQ